MTVTAELRSVDVLVKNLIEEALTWQASHLYVEEQKTRCCISVRLPDTSLRDLNVIPQDEGRALVDYIKGLALLDISERQSPQYGCLSVSLPGGGRRFRVGSLPFMDTQRRQRVVVWLTTNAPC